MCIEKRFQKGVVTALHAAAEGEPRLGCDAAETGAADSEGLSRLKGEVESLRLQLAVTRLVVRDVSAHVDDDAGVDLIINDVVSRWLERDQAREPSLLDGPDGFWNWYANRVEFAPPGSDHEYRAEFCPQEPERLEIEEYYEAVWHAHIAGLRAMASAAPERCSSTSMIELLQAADHMVRVGYQTLLPRPGRN